MGISGLLVQRKRVSQHVNKPKPVDKPVPCVPRGLRLGYEHVRLEPERVKRFLTSYGQHGLAYTHLDKNYRHFELPGVGLVSYYPMLTPLGRQCVVLTDPLASDEGMPTLLARFHSRVPGLKAYVGVSKRVAGPLREHWGHKTTMLGQDYYLDLKVWSLPKKSSLRRYLKQGRKQGLQAKEQTWAEVDGVRVMDISREWLKTKKNGGSELQLMTWPFRTGDEWACRKFYCYDREGVLLSYVFFLPCHRDGKLVGYCANILRQAPGSKPSYALDYLICEAIETLRKEGLDYVSLAPAMLYNMERTDGESSTLRRLCEYLVDNPLYPYSINGTGKHKDHFKANRVEKLFFCAGSTAAHIGGFAVPSILSNVYPFAKLLGVDTT